MSEKPNKMIVGHNGFHYQLDKEWIGAQERKYPLRDCHEMVLAPNGLLYMLGNEMANNILVINKDGKIMNAWGNDFPGGHGLSIHDENGEHFLYITDTVRHKVFKTTLTGKIILELDYPEEVEAYSKAEDFKPTETLVMDNGDIYVTDGYGLQFVIQYDAKGKYIRHFGGKGAAVFNLDCAHGIALDNRDAANLSLLVTSRNENAFKQFGLTGQYLGTISIPGAFVCRPVIHQKNIYAAVFRSIDNQHFGSGFLTILDQQNRIISSPGAKAPIYLDGYLQPQQQIPGLFIHPHDVCIDEDENLYVPQWNSGRTYPVRLTRI